MPSLDETGMDMLLGIGGSPEAVTTACALKCLGGDLQCRYWPRNDKERELAEQQNLSLSQILTIDDLVADDDVFFSLTGVTTGELVRGVRYTPNGAFTETLAMRGKSGTVRRVQSTHNFDKLMRYSALAYDKPRAMGAGHDVARPEGGLHRRRGARAPRRRWRDPVPQEPRRGADPLRPRQERRPARPPSAACRSTTAPASGPPPCSASTRTRSRSCPAPRTASTWWPRRSTSSPATTSWSRRSSSRRTSTPGCSSRRAASRSGSSARASTSRPAPSKPPSTPAPAPWRCRTSAT